MVIDLDEDTTQNTTVTYPNELGSAATPQPAAVLTVPGRAAPMPTSAKAVPPVTAASLTPTVKERHLYLEAQLASLALRVVAVEQQLG